MQGFGGYGGGMQNQNQNQQQFGAGQPALGFTQGIPGHQPQAGANQAQKTDYDKRCLLPITVKQFLGSPAVHEGQPMTIDGVEVSMVKLVGQIAGIDAQETKTNILVDDSTGKLEVTIWKRDDAPMPQLIQWQYVRVYGRANVYQERKQVNAFKVEPLADHNELTHHLLDVISTHMDNVAKAPNPQAQTAQTSMPAQPQQAGGYQNQATFQQPMQGFVQPMQPTAQTFNTGNPGMSMDMDQDAVAELTGLQLKIFQFIRSQTTSDDTGINVDAIFGAIDPSRQQQEAVKSAIDHLLNEGNIYTTVDDEHFAATCDD